MTDLAELGQTIMRNEALFLVGIFRCTDAYGVLALIATTDPFSTVAIGVKAVTRHNLPSMATHSSFLSNIFSIGRRARSRNRPRIRKVRALVAADNLIERGPVHQDVRNVFVEHCDIPRLNEMDHPPLLIDL